MSGPRGVPDASVPLADVLARWDALAVRWHLDDEERTALLGTVAPGPVDDVRTYDVAAGERRMRLLIELHDVASAVLGDGDRVRQWLRRPNVSLGGSPPIVVMANSPDWVAWLIHSLRIAM